MTTRSDLGESPSDASHPPSPTGRAGRYARRTANLDSIGMESRAANFNGLPPGVKHPDQVIDTFKAAAAALGIPKSVVELIDHLFRRTQPRDWQAGTRPLAWPSNLELGHSMGRRPTAISDAIRGAVTLGIIVMKDSPSAKRYGARDDQGAIVQARSFGFDLSPLALRYEEFRDITTKHRTEHRERMDARRQVTREREALFQILDTASELELWSPALAQIAQRAEETRALLTPTLGLAETQHLARCLANWRVDARALLEQAVQNQQETEAQASRTDPESESLLSEIRELKNTTDSSLPIENTKTVVIAHPGQSSGKACVQPLTPTREAGTVGTEEMTPAEAAKLEAKGITPARVADFCPIIGATVGPDPTWSDLGSACRQLAANYEISHRTWFRAQSELGAQTIVVAFAILASLPPERFTKGPGAYFAGMVKAHRDGRLNVLGSFHGMRERADAGTCPIEPPGRVKSTYDNRAVGHLATGVLAKLKAQMEKTMQ